MVSCERQGTISASLRTLMSHRDIVSAVLVPPRGVQRTYQQAATRDVDILYCGSQDSNHSPLPVPSPTINAFPSPTTKALHSPGGGTDHENNGNKRSSGFRCKGGRWLIVLQARNRDNAIAEGESPVSGPVDTEMSQVTNMGQAERNLLPSVEVPENRHVASQDHSGTTGLWTLTSEDVRLALTEVESATLSTSLSDMNMDRVAGQVSDGDQSDQSLKTLQM